MENWFIWVLAAAGAVGSTLIYFALRQSDLKRVTFQAFADEQGWHYDPNAASHDETSVQVFSDPNDDWVLKIVFIGGGAVGGSPKRRLEWYTPQGALQEGEAVLGMPLPEKTAAMLQSGGSIAEQMIKAALKATLYAIGNTKFDLKIDEATAGDPGGMVMASPGQAGAMDAFRRNEDLARFRKEYKKADVPVIIRNDGGLTLRRPGSLRRVEDLAAFVQLGKSLRADLDKDQMS